MEKKYKKSVTLETFILLAIFGLFFGYIGHVMGMGNLFNTLMKTAHDLLLNTVFFIMGIAILAGAIAAVLSEFGVIDLINRMITPIMRPLYNLPGAAALGIITTFLSDNPAIIGLAHDKSFAKYFKNYELPALCNLGTAFGMGLVVWTFMASQGNGTEFFKAAGIGLLGAVAGSIVSVRIMMHFTKKYYAGEQESDCENSTEIRQREVREGSAFGRALEAALDGGKNGVNMGLAIMPGVVIVCTLVMILTIKPQVDSTGAMIFSGGAYEGIGLVPRLGEKLMFIIRPLFGIQSPEAIAFPLTALGAVGAAMGMVPRFIQNGVMGGNEIAVFTAMGMCWSGYLSTHIAMMDALGVRKLSNKAILSHTIGGFFAGIAAHFIYLLL